MGIKNLLKKCIPFPKETGHAAILFFMKYLGKNKYVKSDYFGEDLSLQNYKWDALCDLVPFVQFKKREKQPWRRATN